MLQTLPPRSEGEEMQKVKRKQTYNVVRRGNAILAEMDMSRSSAKLIFILKMAN